MGIGFKPRPRVAGETSWCWGWNGRLEVRAPSGEWWCADTSGVTASDGAAE